MTATLDLYVNGTFRQALNMNSIQSWQYEGNNNYNGSDQNPADGDPRDFWDEFHAFVSGAAIPAGATFSLQKDSTNTASSYWINSIDLWDAPAPAAQPANSISITSCGAVADNTPTNGAAAPGATDSTVDIQNCINQAASAGEILWIPQGTFYLIGTVEPGRAERHHRGRRLLVQRGLPRRAAAQQHAAGGGCSSATRASWRTSTSTPTR